MCCIAHGRRAAPNVREDEAMGFAWSERAEDLIRGVQSKGHTGLIHDMRDQVRPRRCEDTSYGKGQGFVAFPAWGGRQMFSG
jgi:hypothetical protein